MSMITKLAVSLGVGAAILLGIAAFGNAGSARQSNVADFYHGGSPQQADGLAHVQPFTGGG